MQGSLGCLIWVLFCWGKEPNVCILSNVFNSSSNLIDFYIYLFSFGWSEYSRWPGLEPGLFMAIHISFIHKAKPLNILFLTWLAIYVRLIWPLNVVHYFIPVEINLFLSIKSGITNRISLIIGQTLHFIVFQFSNFIR